MAVVVCACVRYIVSLTLTRGDPSTTPIRVDRVELEEFEREREGERSDEVAKGEGSVVSSVSSIYWKWK